MNSVCFKKELKVALSKYLASIRTRVNFPVPVPNSRILNGCAFCCSKMPSVFKKNLTDSTLYKLGRTCWWVAEASQAIDASTSAALCAMTSKQAQALLPK